eukprot:COSAG03_NODE_21607_length_286_cov_0.748768_1_plen_65_part_01
MRVAAAGGGCQRSPTLRTAAGRWESKKVERKIEHACGLAARARWPVAPSLALFTCSLSKLVASAL